MTRRDDLIRFRHMLQHAREAVQFAEGRSREDLKQDRQLELVLTRLVEVVGEAAARVSYETQQRHP